MKLIIYVRMTWFAHFHLHNVLIKEYMNKNLFDDSKDLQKYLNERIFWDFPQ